MAVPIIKVSDPSLDSTRNFGYGMQKSEEPVAGTVPNFQNVTAAPAPAEANAVPNVYAQQPTQPIQQDPGYSPCFQTFMLPPEFSGRVGVNQFVNPVDPAAVYTSPFNPNGLLQNNTIAPQTVGMPQLRIEKTPTTSQEEAKPANQPEVPQVSFHSNLVTPVERESSNRFGIQPLADEVDLSMLPKPVVRDDAHLSKSDDAQTISKFGDRKMNNWFTRLIEQRGEDYIKSGELTIEEVSKNAERIIDEMMLGKIDYSKLGQYIIYPIVIETLINYCSNKLAINKAIQFSLGYTYNDYVNRAVISNRGDYDRAAMLAQIDDGLGRNITQAIAIVNQDIDTYEIVYNKLMYVNSTKNVTSLFSLANDLSNYKKAMRKRY